MSDKKILINLFHPNFGQSRGSRALLDAVSDLPNATTRNLYEVYPDSRVDSGREQELLLTHDVIVMQHPMYWFSTPPLLKQWQDSVLLPGFAFPPGTGDKLKGKIWQTVMTTGGPEEGYTREGPMGANFDDILLPQKLTATYCGMLWQAPFVVTSVMPEGSRGMRAISQEELLRNAEEYRCLLESY